MLPPSARLPQTRMTARKALIRGVVSLTLMVSSAVSNKIAAPFVSRRYKMGLLLFEPKTRRAIDTVDVLITINKHDKKHAHSRSKGHAAIRISSRIHSPDI